MTASDTTKATRVASGEGITEATRFTFISVSGVQRRSAVRTAVDARMSRTSGAMTRRRGMSGPPGMFL
jgi:hypothetical protein